MKHSSVEAQRETPTHPPQSTFNTVEAERLRASNRFVCQRTDWCLSVYR